MGFFHPSSSPRILLPGCAEGLNDLHVYDPVAMAWIDLSIGLSSTSPSPRRDHGFASAGGKLYVYGGANDKSKCIGVLWLLWQGKQCLPQALDVTFPHLHGTRRRFWAGTRALTPPLPIRG
jgi:hypothetical protein